MSSEGRHYFLNNKLFWILINIILANILEFFVRQYPQHPSSYPVRLNRRKKSQLAKIRTCWYLSDDVRYELHPRLLPHVHSILVFHVHGPNYFVEILIECPILLWM